MKQIFYKHYNCEPKIHFDVPDLSEEEKIKKHKEMAKDVWELGEFALRLLTDYQDHG